VTGGAGPGLVELADARGPDIGGKIAPLAELARVGFDVPNGFVVPAAEFRSAVAGLNIDGPTKAAREELLRRGLTSRLGNEVDAALDRLTRAAPTGYVAVRSSSSSEDTNGHSAAGQYDSVLAVRGGDQVRTAILTCWASTWTDRAVAYRARQSDGAARDQAGGMAVLVQEWVDARVSGVMFVQGATTVIEASWGLGEGLVSGRVTPDSWTVEAGRIVARRLGAKLVRSDRVEGEVVTSEVSAADRERPCLTSGEARRLSVVGEEIARVCGGARDIEWALDGVGIRILQARPVTADLPGVEDASAPGEPRGKEGASGSAPAAPTGAAAGQAVLRGIPGAAGTATGPVRHVRGPADFRLVRPGDVLVCRETDPAWTPLFTVAAAIITEVGGALSHAAIVAREVGIPAVLAVPDAAESLAAGALVHVDGGAGEVWLK